MILSASILATPVRGNLERTRRYRVLHLFERVVNLVSEAGEVLSLVGDRDLLGPFAAVVPGLAAHIPTLSADDEPRSGAEEISFPSLAVSFAGAGFWDPRPRWEAARAAGWISGAGDALRTTGDAMWIEAGGRIARAASAVERRKYGSLVREVEELAGRGAGLTPAGDDVLIGALHAVWARWNDERALEVSRIVVDAARGRTTTLSAAWLSAAARGEAALPWHEWVDVPAVEVPSADRLAAAAAGIRVLGDSSGRIALAAFLGAESALRSAL